MPLQALASTRVSATEKITVRLPWAKKSFRTHFADYNGLDCMRITVSGQGIDEPIPHDGPECLPITDPDLNVTVSDVPLKKDALRFVTVQGYDAQGNALLSFVSRGFYVSDSKQIVQAARRNNLLVGVLELVSAQNPSRLSELDLVALQAVMEAVQGFDAQTGTFTYQPEQFDLQALVNALPETGLPDATALRTAALGLNASLSGSLQTASGFPLGEDLILLSNDPSSKRQILPYLSSSPVNYNLPLVNPGNWNLEIRRLDGSLVAQTTANVTQAGEASLGDNPLVLTGIQEILGEFQVNTVSTGSQLDPDVAIDEFGNFVVTWADVQAGDQRSIKARRYNSLGQAVSSEFQVNTLHTDQVEQSAIAMDQDGGFVITWTADLQGDFGREIYARRYNSAGTPLGTEFKINEYTSSVQTEPAIALDSRGDFVITWVGFGQDEEGLGIFARRFNRLGTPKSSDFHVNTFTSFTQSSPTVASDADGDFVIAWESYSHDPYADVFARRYNSAGVAQGIEFQVNAYTTGKQAFASIALDHDGDFVLAWTDYGDQNGSQEGDYSGVFARRYSSLGQALDSSEFQVNTFTSSFQSTASVGMDDEGDFVIAWQSPYQDGNQADVFAQRYNVAGQKQGNELQINQTSSNYHWYVHLAMQKNGNWVAAWLNEDLNVDGNITARRFDAQGRGL